MKDAQPKSTNDILLDLQGQILGLKAVLTSVLVANPGIKIEDHQVGRTIILAKGLPVDDPKISKRARDFSLEITGPQG